MSDEEKVPPLDYAEPALPGGGSFRELAYPSDDATFLNPAKVVDNGVVLQIRPGSAVLRVVFLALVLIVFVLVSSYREVHARFEFPIVPICIVVAIAAYSFNRVRSRNRMPWMMVDRHRRVVSLPRAKKVIRFDEIVRLQVVSFGRVGLSKYYLSYRSEPNSGEVQIVVRNQNEQQTWSVVAWPSNEVLRQFVKAFTTATGIPVSRAFPLQSGDWKIKAFDDADPE